MNTRVFRLTLASLALVIGIQACAPAPIASGADTAATSLAATISVMQMTVSAIQTLPTPPPTLVPSATLIAPPTSTNTSIPFLIVTATPNIGTDNSTVIHEALCWLGPGPGYVVSSALLTGTRVVVLGYSSIGGWWVVRDPIYNDPCWMYQKDLQIDPGVNPYALRVFYPPPTPTSTPTPTPTSTFTLTPTP